MEINLNDPIFQEIRREHREKMAIRLKIEAEIEESEKSRKYPSMGLSSEVKAIMGIESKKDFLAACE